MSMDRAAPIEFPRCTSSWLECNCALPAGHPGDHQTFDWRIPHVTTWDDGPDG